MDIPNGRLFRLARGDGAAEEVLHGPVLAARPRSVMADWRCSARTGSFSSGRIACCWSNGTTPPAFAVRVSMTRSPTR